MRILLADLPYSMFWRLVILHNKTKEILDGLKNYGSIVLLQDERNRWMR
jgi:hypothetical protein